MYNFQTRGGKEIYKVSVSPRENRGEEGKSKEDVQTIKNTKLDGRNK